MKRSFLSLSIASLIIGAIATLDAPASAEMLRERNRESMTESSSLLLRISSGYIYEREVTKCIFITRIDAQRLILGDN
jgi:hypothetical protein